MARRLHRAIWLHGTEEIRGAPTFKTHREDRHDAEEEKSRSRMERKNQECIGWQHPRKEFSEV